MYLGNSNARKVLDFYCEKTGVCTEMEQVVPMQEEDKKHWSSQNSLEKAILATLEKFSTNFNIRFS